MIIGSTNVKIFSLIFTRNSIITCGDDFKLELSDFLIDFKEEIIIVYI